jgi:prolyl oligopeptidase
MYPRARRLDLTENLHGRLIPDPYRWLEDPASDESRAWLEHQDTLLRDYAAALPGRPALGARIGELMGAGYVSAPVWRGQRQFFLRRTADQEHPVLMTGAPGEPPRALIDPMAADSSGATTLDHWQPDNDGRLLAYQMSERGDEESVLRVIDVVSGELVDGPIDRTRNSPIAWLPGGKAFYYMRRLAPSAVAPGEQPFHRRVYLHVVGRPADEDVLIFGEGRDKTNYYDASVSRDGRWLIISASQGTAPRTDLWLADLSASPADAPALTAIQEGTDVRTSVHVGRDGLLYVFTDDGAPRGKLAVTDPGQPGRAFWRDLVSEDPEAVLADFAILDGAELARPLLLVSWTRHAISELTVHDLGTGERTGALTLPAPGAVGGFGRLGSVSGLTERPEGGHEAWFGYTDYTTPASVWQYDARTSEVTTWADAAGSVDVPAVDTRQVTYRSADGTEVRMLVINSSPGPGPEPDPGTGPEPDPGTGPEPDPGTGPAPDPGGGPRPTILYGYGGFGISLTPAFAPSILAWVEAGGVYVVAGLRGGSEEGEEWHRAGMRDRKQNVFDDFHAAAESLISEGWTTPGQLAISGGSNGGLLVGAAITQRPELYAAAVCSAPLLDMVRYEHYGLGQIWNDEYGTAADPEELGWLLSYSPYHHVREGTSYPAVLFTVFGSDTRVDPVHAWKMCAALQHATSARWPDHPVLLRRESDVGHGARAVSRSVALSADMLAFLALHTGLSG